MAIVYALICLMDFIVIPISISAMRKEVLDDTLKATLAGLDSASQVEFVKAMYRQYVPLTLQGNGVFHISFGALLTGSAITKRSA